MAVTSKLMDIGVIAFSIGLGLLTYYLLHDTTKELKKNHIEELTSQFINFVIYIILGKIILHFSIFMTDPLAILAYPSDSRSFYFAAILLTVLFLFKAKRKSIQFLPLLESFIFIFVVSAFVFEFIQFVVLGNSFAFGSILLLALLIGLLILLKDKMARALGLKVIVTVGAIGLLVLSFMQPFVTVYGYLMAPWFIVLFWMIFMGILMYEKRGMILGS